MKNKIMNTKTIKTILFASLIAAMILPLSGMNYAQAQEQTNKTDQELIDEWNRSFRNKITSDEPSDEIKIDIMKGLYEAKENPQPQSDADKKYYEEQSEVLEKARALYDRINETTDQEIKESLETELESMKTRMAEVGIFFPEDVDNRPFA